MTLKTVRYVEFKFYNLNSNSTIKTCNVIGKMWIQPIKPALVTK